MTTSCATKLEPYAPNAPESLSAPTNFRVAVIEFEDQSPPDVAHGIGIASLPGVLYGKVYTHYTPATFPKFGSCLASELHASNMFPEVTYFSSWGVGTATFHDYDLIVSGRLFQDKRESYMVNYGLTPILFSFFALMGIPSNFEDRDVSFDVVATWAKSPGQLILTKTIAFEEPSRWYGAMWGIDGNWQAGEGRIARNGCPSEYLNKPFIELRKGLLEVIQTRMTKPEMTQQGGIQQ
jgi:hypothetical protein